MDTPARRLRSLAMPLLIALIAVACSIEAPSFSDVAAPGVSPAIASSDEVALDQLPVLGPSLSSHWHAAYIVRICDDVLEPLDSAEDPLGIHSHQDGLIHIHPFFDEAAYEEANLGLFADAMGMAIAEGELTVPGSGTWRDGDLCGDRPGRVFVDKWAGPGAEGGTVRYFEDLDKIRFEADRELYQIGFAPEDSPPVVPPSIGQLDQVSAPINVTEPWVDVDRSASVSDVRVWPVAEVSGPPCAADAVEERVRTGTPGCFVPGDVEFTAAEAFTSARAVNFNRQAAVEVRPAPALQRLLRDSFLQGLQEQNTEEGLILAIQIGDRVVTASRLVRYAPEQSRLVLTGGFTASTASALADLLTS